MGGRRDEDKEGQKSEKQREQELSTGILGRPGGFWQNLKIGRDVNSNREKIKRGRETDMRVFPNIAPCLKMLRYIF